MHPKTRSHTGLGHGLHVAEMAHFAPLDWIPFGLRASECICPKSKDAARINVKRFSHFLDKVRLEGLRMCDRGLLEGLWDGMCDDG